jgi:uncharacterized membrane protein
MLTLLLGLVLFVGPHVLPTSPHSRGFLRDRMGPSAYLLVFSIISLVSMIVIAKGYGDARLLGKANPQLWQPPAFTRHIALALMLPAFVLMAAAYIPSRIRTAVKHPMLASIKLWALAHLLVRGDLASVVLFGSFLAYAVFDRISVKRRNAYGPLGTAAGTIRGDIAAVVVGSVAYVAMYLIGHSALIGVALSRLSFAP